MMQRIDGNTNVEVPFKGGIIRSFYLGGRKMVVWFIEGFNYSEYGSYYDLYIEREYYRLRILSFDPTPTTTVFELIDSKYLSYGRVNKIDN